MSSIEIYFQLITVFDGVRQTDLYKRESVQNNETIFACKTTALFSFFNHVCVHECVRACVCMYVCMCVCVCTPKRLRSYTECAFVFVGLEAYEDPLALR
jgi:hypothetical protein